jgi:hypothetical protein
MFARRRKTKQFCQARFVRLAGGTIAIRLNPFWMLHPQSVMDLLAKLSVRADLALCPRKSVRLHPGRYERSRLPPLRVCGIFRYYLRGNRYSLERGGGGSLLWSNKNSSHRFVVTGLGVSRVGSKQKSNENKTTPNHSAAQLASVASKTCLQARPDAPAKYVAL